MATTKFASIKARRIRVTAVDSCGTPTLGACGTIVTSGFVSVNASAQVEDGEEFVVKNAWGEFCVNEVGESRVKRWDTTIELCEVDPQLLSMLSGGRVLLNDDDLPVGGTFGETVGEDFALEMWTKVAGGTCADVGEEDATWVYWVFPHISGGVIGDLQFENGPLSMTVTAHTLGAGSDWGTGAYEDSPLPEALESTEHIAYVVTSTAPPDDTDGCTELLTTVESTAGVAGIPGSWTPVGSRPPATVAALIAGDPVTVTASPNTAWTTGQYVQTRTSGVGGRAHWNGTIWVTGVAP